MAQVSLDWKNISVDDKAFYNNLASDEKKKYEDYKKLKPTKFLRKTRVQEDDKILKRAPSAFVLYFRDINIAGKIGTLKVVGLARFSKNVAELWKNEQIGVKNYYKTKSAEIKDKIEQRKIENSKIVPTSNENPTFPKHRQVKVKQVYHVFHQPFINYCNDKIESLRELLTPSYELENKKLTNIDLRRRLAEHWKKLSRKEQDFFIRED